MEPLPNVLIVDDLPENLFFLREVLQNEKVNLIEALSGEEALIKTKGIELALAILDVRMPLMNGYQLAEKLNGDKNRDKIPIIFATANYTNAKEMEKGYLSGVVDYLVKPISKHILLSKIKVFLDLFNQKQTILNKVVREKKMADELVQSNEALHVSEERLRSILFNIADWVWETDENGAYTFSSQNGPSFLGFSKDELTGKTPFDFMMQNEAERLMPIVTELIENRKPIKDLENWNIGSEGQQICLLTNASPVFDKKGNFKGYRGVDKNITEQKNAKDLLEQTRQNYETFFNTINDFLFVLDKNGNIVYTNNTVNKRLAYSKEELLSKSVLSLHPLDQQEEAGQIVNQILEGKTEFCDVPLVSKTSVQIPVETRVVHGIWNGNPVVFAVSKDISQIKLSEEKFSKVFYLNPSACGLSDLLTQQYIEVNEAFFTLFGFEKDEVIGKTAIELGIMDAKTRESILIQMNGNGAVRNAETQLKSKQGEIIHVLISADNIQIQDKIYRFTIISDITHRKKIEENLRTYQVNLELQNEELILAQEAETLTAKKYTELYNIAPTGYFTLSSKKAIQEVNHSGARLLGKEPLPLINSNFSFFVSQNTLPVFNAFFLNIFKSKVKEICEVVLETDGNEPKHVHIEGLVFGNGKQCLINVINITENKQAEEKLRESDKHFRTIYNNTPALLHSLDKNGLLISVSDFWLSTLGYKKSEVLGKPSTMFLTESSKRYARDIAFPKFHENDFIANAPYQFVKKNGEVIDVLLSAIAIRDNLGEMNRTLAVLVDITDRKKVEKALIKSEEKYRLIFESFHDIYYRANNEGIITELSPSVLQISGYKPDELIGKPATNVYQNKADRIYALKALKESGRLTDYELKLVTKDKKVRICSLCSHVIVGQDGETKGVEGVIRDITERKQMEEEKENLLYQLSERIKELNCLYGIAKVIEKYENNIDKIFEETAQILTSAWQYTNITCARIISGIIEYKTDNFLETKWKQSSDIKVHGKITGEMVVCYLEEKPESDEGPFLKEERNLIEAVAVKLGRIFERKQAEDEIRAAKENLKNTFDLSPSIISKANIDTGYFVEANHAVTRLLGYSVEEFTSKPLMEFIHPDERNRTMDEISEQLKGKEVIFFENRYLCKDGSYTWLAWHGTKADENGIVTAIGSDINEIKIAEQELKVSEEKYKTMLNASPDGITLIDMKGIIIEVSEIGLELLGVENTDELIGKHFFRFVPTDEKIIIKEAIEKTLSEGIVQNIELKIRKKNQSLFLSEISLTLIQNNDGAIYSFMVTIRDISQRKKMEKKQIHADRMSSLGEMASGIAHEINQPLNTMSMVMDNILFESSREENMKNEYLKKKSNKIFQNITRIRNIIDHVRAFSRSSDDYIATNFDINASIRNAVSMISEQFNHLAIDLRFQLDENQPTVSGNTFKFEQVILNMLINAKDALLEKGKIQPEFQDKIIEIKSYRENQSFVVEVIDNGTGISEEDIEHIMLPFYTTKDTGKGTGLGLSISYQIIKEMNGSIEISDNVYHGTTFKILLNS